MKKTHFLLAAILISLALLFGFSFPAITSSIQDNTIQNQVTTEKITGINLDFTRDLTIPEKLMMHTESLSTVQLEEGNNMDYSQVVDSIHSFIDMLSKYGFPCLHLGNYYIDNLSPHLVVMDDGSGVSFIVWLCTAFDDFGNYANITIDDETGMVLSFECSYYNYDSTNTDLSESFAIEKSLSEDFCYELTNIWADICTVYYGFECEVNYYGDYLFLLSFGFGEQESSPISFNFDGFSYSFNTFSV